MSLSRRDFVQRAGASLLLKTQLLRAQQAAVHGVAAQGATTEGAARSAKLRSHLDQDWFRKGLLDEIDRWRNSAELPSGFVQQSLDRQWRPAGEQVGTLSSQGRHIVMRARGYDLTHNPAYLDSVRRIADFTLTKFRDPRYGGHFFSVSPDGKVIDDRKDAYGAATFFLGLSHAARVTRDAKYRQAALETWAQMKKGLRDKAGLFKYATTPDYSQPPGPPPTNGGGDAVAYAPPPSPPGNNTQDPLMYVFDALLAYYDATGSKQVLAEAEAHGNAVFTKLFQSETGSVPEFYDASWKLLREDGVGHAQLGHQFEWAYLWSLAVARGFPHRDLQQYGERVLAFGMKAGYDPKTGGTFSISDSEGRPVKGPKELWHQCEFLRALMNYAAVHDRGDLWAAFDKSLAMFKEHFIDAQYGGFFSNYYDPKTPSDAAQLGKNGMDCFHVSGMYSEALMLTGGLS